MSAPKVGDRVRDTCWGGRFVGRVNRVDGDALFVTWDGHFADYEMRPDQLRKEDGR